MKNQTSYSVGVLPVDLPKRFDHCNILRNIASACRGNGYSTSTAGSPFSRNPVLPPVYNLVSRMFPFLLWGLNRPSTLDLPWWFPSPGPLERCRKASLDGCSSQPRRKTFLSFFFSFLLCYFFSLCFAFTFIFVLLYFCFYILLHFVYLFVYVLLFKK